ncbi:MAG: hypothetical protein F6K42_12960 [Leptolyngbya sp. SIO1D8]|nr:hypothetical protein [Leptolyngbya sp. SIO1D8]
MATGKQHDRSIQFASLALLPCVLINPLAGISAAACLGGGLFLSPDIDLGENRKLPPKPVQRLKKLHLWWWWSPFCWIRHRHALSHLPGLCTALKLAWLWLTVYVPINAALIQMGFGRLLATWIIPTGITWFGEVCAAGAIGLFIADVTHWAMDGFPVRW